MIEGLSAGQVNIQNRRMLIASLIMYGVCRPSIIQEMTVKEVDLVEELRANDRMVWHAVAVHRHEMALLGLFNVPCPDFHFPALKLIQ